MIGRRISVVLVLLLAGCHKEPVSVASTDNAEIAVGRLFQIDGCQVYRFGDGGEAHYFARCGNQVSTSSVSQDCYYNSATKTQQCDQRREEIPTLEAP